MCKYSLLSAWASASSAFRCWTPYVPLADCSASSRAAIGSADLISFLGVFPTKLILDRGEFQYGDYVHINSTKNQGTYAFDGEQWVYVDCKYIHGENPPPPTVHDARATGVDPGSLGT